MGKEQRKQAVADVIAWPLAERNYRFAGFGFRRSLCAWLIDNSACCHRTDSQSVTNDCFG